MNIPLWEISVCRRGASVCPWDLCFAGTCRNDLGPNVRNKTRPVQYTVKALRGARVQTCSPTSSRPKGLSVCPSAFSVCPAPGQPMLQASGVCVLDVLF